MYEVPECINGEEEGRGLRDFVVWYAPGVFERVEAEDIRECSRKVRETRPKERTFTIVPVEDWAEMRALWSLGRHQTTEDRIRLQGNRVGRTEAEINAEVQRARARSSPSMERVIVG